MIGNYTFESTQMVDDRIGASLAVHVDAQHNHTLRVLRILVFVLEKKKEKYLSKSTRSRMSFYDSISLHLRRGERERERALFGFRENAGK